MDSAKDNYTGARHPSIDLISCVAGAAVTFSVYIGSIAPHVTLEWSGLYSVSAVYGGVGPPPGYPLWTICGWLFTKLIPFGNIGWRLAVFSALAAAGACGLIAFLISRIGGKICPVIAPLLSRKQEAFARIVAGMLGACAFGFDGAFWTTAVIVEVWPLSILLLMTTICLLCAWNANPSKYRLLFAAAFAYGLTITNSQALMTAGPGIVAFVVITKPGIFRRWKVFLSSMLFFALGSSLYFYVPIASMTNPPVNWAYPRTVEGFWHSLSRGQYERVDFVGGILNLKTGLTVYLRTAVHDVGLINLLLALVPLTISYRLSHNLRRCMFGLTVLFCSMLLLLSIVVNPGIDRQSVSIADDYFGASHCLLAVASGIGVLRCAALFAPVRRHLRKQSNNRESKSGWRGKPLQLWMRNDFTSL